MCGQKKKMWIGAPLSLMQVPLNSFSPGGMPIGPLKFSVPSQVIEPTLGRVPGGTVHT